VIGRRKLPDGYVNFNQRWGAPHGRPAAGRVPLPDRLGEPRAEYGPFAFQIASGTRVFEYPWIYSMAGVTPGCRVLDAGGCVGGLQFVLAMQGCQVVNVDPFDEGGNGWPVGSARHVVTPEHHERLNQLFRTDVQLITKRLQDADLPDGSFDRVVSVSVLEHLPQAEAQALVAQAGRLLAPGGLLLATVDLFLDLEPFGVLSSNCYGTNLDLAALVAGSGLELEFGDRRELFGFPEFDRDRIVAQLDDLLVAPRYPVVSQAIALRKPA
jgi:SAM-dependent methyltransferase